MTATFAMTPELEAAYEELAKAAARVRALQKQAAEAKGNRRAEDDGD